MRALLCGGLVLLSACKQVELPWRGLAAPERSAPAHALRLVVLPLVDARQGEDAQEVHAFEYGGVELRGTRSSELSGGAIARFTELLARALVERRCFVQVILVDRPEDAPEADLILRGELRRARGYVEARPPDPRSGRPASERRVLAEYYLSNVEIRDLGPSKRRLFDADIGWSIDEARLISQHEPEPWGVLAEAMERALRDFADALAAARLVNGTDIAERVALPSAVCAVTASGAPALLDVLSACPPSGWSAAGTSSAARPRGWKSSAARCGELELRQERTRRFHRALGPYTPAVHLWSCPMDQVYDYDGREEFPALYLGEARGRHVFGRAVGQSNWPGSLEQVSERLGLARPAARHVFRLAPPGK